MISDKELEQALEIDGKGIQAGPELFKRIQQEAIGRAPSDAYGTAPSQVRRWPQIVAGVAGILLLVIIGTVNRGAEAEWLGGYELVYPDPDRDLPVRWSLMVPYSEDNQYVNQPVDSVEEAVQIAGFEPVQMATGAVAALRDTRVGTFTTNLTHYQWRTISLTYQVGVDTYQLDSTALFYQVDESSDFIPHTQVRLHPAGNYALAAKSVTLSPGENFCFNRTEEPQGVCHALTHDGLTLTLLGPHKIDVERLVTKLFDQ